MSVCKQKKRIRISKGKSDDYLSLKTLPELREIAKNEGVKFTGIPKGQLVKNIRKRMNNPCKPGKKSVESRCVLSEHLNRYKLEDVQVIATDLGMTDIDDMSKTSLIRLITKSLNCDTGQFVSGVTKVCTDSKNMKARIELKERTEEKDNSLLVEEMTEKDNSLLVEEMTEIFKIPVTKLMEIVDILKEMGKDWYKNRTQYDEVKENQRNIRFKEYVITAQLLIVNISEIVVTFEKNNLKELEEIREFIEETKVSLDEMILTHNEQFKEKARIARNEIEYEEYERKTNDIIKRNIEIQPMIKSLLNLTTLLTMSLNSIDEAGSDDEKTRKKYIDKSRIQLDELFRHIGDVKKDPRVVDSLDLKSILDNTEDYRKTLDKHIRTYNEKVQARERIVIENAEAKQKFEEAQAELKKAEDEKNKVEAENENKKIRLNEAVESDDSDSDSDNSRSVIQESKSIPRGNQEQIKRGRRFVRKNQTNMGYGLRQKPTKMRYGYSPESDLKVAQSDLEVAKKIETLRAQTGEIKTVLFFLGELLDPETRIYTQNDELQTMIDTHVKLIIQYGCLETRFILSEARNIIGSESLYNLIKEGSEQIPICGQMLANNNMKIQKDKLTMKSGITLISISLAALEKYLNGAIRFEDLSEYSGKLEDFNTDLRLAREQIDKLYLFDDTMVIENTKTQTMYEDLIYILTYQEEKTSAKMKPIIINQDENTPRPTISDIISSQTNVINIILIDFLDGFSDSLKHKLSREYKKLIDGTGTHTSKYNEYKKLTGVIGETVAHISTYACLEIKLILLQAKSTSDKNVVEMIEGNTDRIDYRINYCNDLIEKNPSIEEVLTKILSLKKFILNDMVKLRLELRKSVYNEWIYNEVINTYFLKNYNVWNDQLNDREELLGARYTKTKTHTYWEMLINLFLANYMNYDSTPRMIDDDGD